MNHAAAGCEQRQGAWGRALVLQGEVCRSLRRIRDQRRTVPRPAARDRAGGAREAVVNRVRLSTPFGKFDYAASAAVHVTLTTPERKRA